jgi:hypothetical protein
VLLCTLYALIFVTNALQISHYPGKSAWQILKTLRGGGDDQVRELQEARAAKRKVVVFFWGLQNCMEEAAYIEAVVGICSVLRG